MIISLKCFQHPKDTRTLQVVIDLIGIVSKLNPESIENKFYSHILTDETHVSREKRYLKDKKWTYVESNPHLELLADHYVLAFVSSECVHYNKRGKSVGGYAILKTCDWILYEQAISTENACSERRSSMNLLTRMFSTVKSRPVANAQSMITVKGNFPAVGTLVRYECLVALSYGKTTEYVVVQTISCKSVALNEPSNERHFRTFSTPSL